MPLLKYSSRYWGTHAKREFSDCGMSLALEHLSRYEDHISAISLLRQSQAGYDFCGSTLFSGLHCASFFGIVELATALVSGGVCEINQPDRSDATPISMAARNGH